jgi:hypothetical protein
MTSGIYAGQKGSKLTEFLQSLRLPDGLQKWLEKAATVPYDRTGGADHRIDTIGHDPILGLVFGVIDLFRGTSTKIKDGNILVEKVASGVPPLEAVLIQFLHLCSDVSTKKGLPVPFASIFRLLDVGAFPRANGKTATISQLMAWMYHNGFDLRHFVTMGITPATIEIVLRLYVLVRHYAEEGEGAVQFKGHPKHRSMLLAAHAIASAANVGKVVLMQGNPLAINYAEWMALCKYLLPSIRYWVFERDDNMLKFMQYANEERWNELLQNSDRILVMSRMGDIQPVCLCGD